MGVRDFAKDAGAKIGIGKSSKQEKAAKEAKAKRAKRVREAQAARAKANRDAQRAAAQKKAAAAKATKIAADAKDAEAKEREAERKKGLELEKYVTGLGLKVSGLDVKFDDGVASVKGVVANKAMKEKVILALGNVQGVKRVKDSLRTRPAKKGATPASAAARKAAATRRKQAGAAQTMHTVKKGDTLSKLAAKYLGDAKRYPEIFKANQPMLTNPDQIDVGQVLRIPKA